MLRCHDNGYVGLYLRARIHEHTYAVLYAHSKSSPEAGCYWLQVCYVSVTMVMLDYIMCAKFHDHAHH